MIDALSLLEEVRKAAPGDRDDVKVRVSRALYDEFHKKCEKQGVSHNLVIEFLMRAFLKSLDQK